MVTDWIWILNRRRVVALYILTTLSLDELSSLLKDKKISTNNVDLFFGAEGSIISDYLKQRLGYNGFVLGIIGQISNGTISQLTGLDPALRHSKVALEIKIQENDALFMNIKDLMEVADYIDLGLDAEDILGQIDTAIQHGSAATNSIVCIPYIPSDKAERLTSLTRDVQIENIAFVKVSEQ